MEEKLRMLLNEIESPKLKSQLMRLLNFNENVIYLTITLKKDCHETKIKLI